MRKIKELAAALVITWAILLLCESAKAAEVRHAQPGEYGPIPQSVQDAIFAEHNIAPDQRKFFVIALRVPVFFGGTNARENLMLLSLREFEQKRDFERSLIGAASRNRITYEKAAQALREWKPPAK